MNMYATGGTLFSEIEQLDNRSLDVFIAHIISLRIRRASSDKQKQEASLLKKINKSLTVEQIERFKMLKDKNTNDNISEKEYMELLLLLEKVEKLNVSRLKQITTLARLRDTPVRELMAQLGILNQTNG